MKSLVSFVALLLVAAFFLFLVPPVYAAIDETPADAQTIHQLELRAQQANPRDQCYLYTELVHTMTEMAVKQIVNGDEDQANATLTKINTYAHLISINLAANTKRLKNAEMLMHHTTLRLAQSLHLASGDDRNTVQATLKQLDVVQNQILDHVFDH